MREVATMVTTLATVKANISFSQGVGDTPMAKNSG